MASTESTVAVLAQTNGATPAGAPAAASSASLPGKRIVVHVPESMTELVQSSTPSAGSVVSAGMTVTPSDAAISPGPGYSVAPDSPAPALMNEPVDSGAAGLSAGCANSSGTSTSCTTTSTHDAAARQVTATSPNSNAKTGSPVFVPPAHSSAPSNDGIMWGQIVKAGPLTWRTDKGKLVQTWAVCKDWALELYPSRTKTGESDRILQVNLIGTRAAAVPLDPYKAGKNVLKNLEQPPLQDQGDPRVVLNVNNRHNSSPVPFVVRALPSASACSTYAPSRPATVGHEANVPTQSRADASSPTAAPSTTSDANATSEQSGAIQPLVVEDLAYDPLAPSSNSSFPTFLPANYLTGRPSIMTPMSVTGSSPTPRTTRGTISIARNAVLQSVAQAAASTASPTAASSTPISGKDRFAALIAEANPPIEVFTVNGQSLGYANEDGGSASLSYFVVLCSQGKRGFYTFAAPTPAERASWLFVLHRLRRFDSGGLPAFLTLTGDEWVDTDLREKSLSASILDGSMDKNTKHSGFLKAAVSKKKRRFCLDGFDLDLTYITGRIIAMGFPSVGREAIYRNDKDDVVRFLETRHPGHYKVYNLCSERPYNKDIFPELLHFPFDDHNPPCFEDIMFCVRDILTWLQAHPDNIACIHCKAGKGRTGLIIVALLLYIGMWETADDALSYYAFVRTKNQKGVTIPSQIRWIYMFEAYLKISRNRLRELRAVHEDVLRAAATTAANSAPATSGAATSTSPSASEEKSAGEAVSPETGAAASPVDPVAGAATSQGTAGVAAATSTQQCPAAECPKASDLSPLLPSVQLPFRLPPMSAFEYAVQLANSLRNPKAQASLSLPPENSIYSEAAAYFSPSGSAISSLQSEAEAKSPTDVDTKQSTSPVEGKADERAMTADALEIPNQPVKQLKISRNSPFYAALANDDLTIGLPDRHVKYLTKIVIGPDAPSHDSFIVQCDGCILSSKDLPITSVKNPNAPVPAGHCKLAKHSDGTIVYDIPIGLIPVEGDFYVEFHKKKFFGGKAKPFSFWLHTQFTSFLGESVTMNRQQLDKAAKKKKGKPFEVTVKLHDPMPHIQPLRATPRVVNLPQASSTPSTTQPSPAQSQQTQSSPESAFNESKSTALEPNAVTEISSSTQDVSGQSRSSPSEPTTASSASTATGARHVVKLHVPANF